MQPEQGRDARRRHGSFSLSFAATELDARSAIASLAERLRAATLPESFVSAVQIAFAEAVNNIVEHAYADAAAGDVQARCDLGPEGLRIEILDSGHPLPDGQLPAGAPVDVSGPRTCLPEGGFGWFLIRELTSELSYLRSGGTNRLTMRFDI